MKSAVEVFKLFLQNVKSADIPLVLLRPREISETISYTGDYDFFISPEFNDSLLSIMFDTAVTTHSSFTVSRVKHGKVDITLYSRIDNKSIALEIWNILSVKDPMKKTLRYIHPEKLNAQIIKKDDGIFSLPLDVESLYYLSHLYTGGKKLTTPLVHERIEYYSSMLKDANSEYQVLFEDLRNEKSEMKSVAHLANMALVEKELLPLKGDIGATLKELSLKTASTYNRTKRKLLAQIRLIPVVGPDGVGKTSLIEGVMIDSQKKMGSFRFKKTFRVSPIYKLFLPILKYKLDKEVNNSIDIGKSEIDDRYGNFVIFNAVLLFPLRVIKNLFSKKFVFVDRYFYEFLFENVRLKLGKPRLRSDWKFLLAFIPRTYMMVHLDAPTKLVLQRKEELDEEGIDAYRKYLFKTQLNKPFTVYCYINTDLPLKQSRNLLLDICKENIKCS